MYGQFDFESVEYVVVSSKDLEEQAVSEPCSMDEAIVFVAGLRRDGYCAKAFALVPVEPHTMFGVDCGEDK